MENKRNRNNESQCQHRQLEARIVSLARFDSSEWIFDKIVRHLIFYSSIIFDIITIIKQYNLIIAMWIILLKVSSNTQINRCTRHQAASRRTQKHFAERWSGENYYYLTMSSWGVRGTHFIIDGSVCASKRKFPRPSKRVAVPCVCDIGAHSAFHNFITHFFCSRLFK